MWAHNLIEGDDPTDGMETHDTQSKYDILKGDHQPVPQGGKAKMQYRKLPLP